MNPKSTPLVEENLISSILSPEELSSILLNEIVDEFESPSRSLIGVINRIALEVQRICDKSDRIQVSGETKVWQLSLARHRLQKCLSFYRLGSQGGRVELHSTLSVMIYRYLNSPAKVQLGFNARCNLIEDFLQEFYAESIKVFRREHGLEANYTPHTQIELAEYMSFTQQYAKRRIALNNGHSQQIIVLRAQSFSKRQPLETPLDIEASLDATKTDDAESQVRQSSKAQIKSQMISYPVDPSDIVLRDRVIQELIKYLQSCEQYDCVDYLTLKLKDLSAPEIDTILGLNPRQRDYLQQRFKYHVERFSRSSNWELVHEWLGADLDQKLGMSSQQWSLFTNNLSPEYQKLLQLKQSKVSELEIARALNWTAKQVQKRWALMLELAWKTRNSEEIGLINSSKSPKSRIKSGVS